MMTSFSQGAQNSGYRKRRWLYSGCNVQRALLIRIALHWTFFATGTFSLLFAAEMFFGSNGKSASFYFAETWHHYGFVFLMMIVLAPALVFDILRQTNRFCGPMLRLRRGLKEAASGAQARPLYFREGDYWMDVAEDFNVVIGRLNSETESNTAETETTVPADGLTVSGETISETTEVDSNESLAACVADAV
jgi:hypothetical protein